VSERGRQAFHLCRSAEANGHIHGLSGGPDLHSRHFTTP
jgi:hypothetical protein